MSQSKGEAKKTPPATNGSKLGQSLRRHLRTLLLTVTACALVGGGVYTVWQAVAPQVLRHGQYRLTLEQLTVTPLPPWIHSDVRSEVFHQGGFEDNVWIHNPNLAEKISKTFELHPWVAKVERVTLRGASVNVDLVYRRPVCMVEVPGGVYPVDVEGVLLPRDDFPPVEARRYPRLAGVATAPASFVGMPWGDLHVVGGAEIAAALADCWQDLKLDHILVINTGTPDILFELVPKTSRKDRIIWGHAPSTRDAAEQSVEQKIAHLKQFLADRQAAGAGATGPRQLDLRRAGGGRTALNPDGAEDNLEEGVSR